MSDDLEQRLREYGTTIDTATAADLAERHDKAVETTGRRVDRHPRRMVTAVAVLVIAGIAAVSVVTIASRPNGTVGAPSTTRVDGTLTAEGGTSSKVWKGYPGVVHAVQGGRTVETEQTRRDGSFTMRLKPGEYVMSGMWKDACGQPCEWRSGQCGQSALISVGRQQVRDVGIVCRLK